MSMWLYRTLSECCNLITDGTHYTPPPVAEGVPFLTVKDLTVSGLDLAGSSKIARDEYERAVAGNSAPKLGDVLFSKDGTVGKVHVVSDAEEFAVLSSIAILRPNPSIVESAFLGYMLRYPGVLHDALNKKTGSAIRRLVLRDLKTLRIPVPPIPEQHRIVDLLSRAEGIVRLRREAEKKATELIHALFLDMFGDPATNPKGWQTQPFGQLVENKDGKRRPIKSADRANRQGPYPYYGASGIIDTFDDYLFEGEHLLIAEDGANLISRSTPITFLATGKYWVNNHAHVVAANGKANLTFLECQLNLRDMTDSITGSAQPKLNQANLNCIPILTPPISAQIRFAEHIEQVRSIESQQAAATDKSQATFDALLASTFSK